MVAHLLMAITFMYCPQLHYELFIDSHLPLGRSPCAGNAPSPSPPFLARFSVFISVFITLGTAATYVLSNAGGQPHVARPVGVARRRHTLPTNPASV